MTAAIALFLFGGITAVLSLQLPLGTLRAPDTGLYPLVLGAMLMGLAALHGVQLHRSRPKAPAEPQSPAAEQAGGGSTRRVAFFMAAVAAATALLVPLGYIATSFLLMLALLQGLGVRKWWTSGLIAAATAVACYLVFVQWLKIPLPDGSIWS